MDCSKHLVRGTLSYNKSLRVCISQPVKPTAFFIYRADENVVHINNHVYDSIASIEKFKKDFLCRFDACGMGDAYYTLGMEIQSKAGREGVCSPPWY